MRAVCIALLVACACACPSKPKTNGGGGGGGGPEVSAEACDGLRTKVEGLYKAEIQRADLVEDNVGMVMRDCKKQPGRVVPCADKATTVADLEKSCLIPLNPDGTEGGK